MERFRMMLTKKQVWVICAFAFVIDIVMGMLLPSFSLYAKRLGAPLTLIGLLGTTIGLTRIVSSLPTGIASDARGRRGVLSLGALLLAVAAFLHTVVLTPRLLIPVRALIGIGMTATFPIGVAYLGDVMPSHQQSLAIGLYYTSMGLGFAIGPVIAGMVTSAYGYAASYRIAAFVAMVGFVIAAGGLSGHASRSRLNQASLEPTGPSSLSLSARLAGLRSRSDVLAAGIANLLVAAAFHGAVVAFLPLRAVSLSVSDETFGILFSVRTLASTAVRVPAGLLNARLSGRHVIIGTLILLGTVHFSVAYASSPVGLVACMIGEGIAYGVFVTSGQGFVIEQSSPGDRGMIVGLYGMLGSIGSTLGPFALGMIADSSGLENVFRLSGMVLSSGVFAFLIFSARRR